MAVNAELISTLEDQVLQLVDHEAWLDTQIRELEFASAKVLDEQTPPPNNTQSKEEERLALEKRIDMLKRELAAAMSIEAIRTKVVDSVYAYQVVLKSLFSKNEHDMDEKSLSNSIQERDQAVTAYLNIHRDLQQARKELARAQGQVLDCQDENRELVQTLAVETANMKEAMSSQETGSNRRMNQKMEEELKNTIIKHSVVSNVLQGLLLESGIDWSNDDRYLALMLKLDAISE